MLRIYFVLFFNFQTRLCTRLSLRPPVTVLRTEARSHRLKTSCAPRSPEKSSTTACPPVKLVTPPWVMTPPKVDLSLTDFPKKSTTPEIYRAHFSEIVNSQPNVTICYTDGSKSGNRVGYASSIGHNSVVVRHRNSVIRLPPSDIKPSPCTLTNFSHRVRLSVCIDRNFKYLFHSSVGLPHPRPPINFDLL